MKPEKRSDKQDDRQITKSCILPAQAVSSVFALDEMPPACASDTPLVLAANLAALAHLDVLLCQ